MSLIEKTRAFASRDKVYDFLIPEPVFDDTLDTRHGPILYLEDISVSFDGFKALNNLNLYTAMDLFYIWKISVLALMVLRRLII